MDYINSAQNTLTSGVQSLGQTIDTAKASVSTTMNDFSSKNVLNASSDFLAANSLIAKFVFIILILIAFMILFSLGTAFLSYMVSPTKTPRFVTGVRSGSRFKQIAQDPTAGGAQVVFRSNNQESGIEFTWELWLKVDSLRARSSSANVNKDDYSHIFHKGNQQYLELGTSDTGIAKTNNGPGLYLLNDSSGVATISFFQNVVSPTDGSQLSDKQLKIKNIPLGKWFHLALRLKNRVLDAYVNGQIAARTIFKEIPKQNYDDVYLCDGLYGGFPGSICDLRYFDRALSVFEINSIVSRGPNLAMNDDLEGDPGEYDYLSSTWYNNLWKSS